MIYALFVHVSCLNPHFWCLDHHFWLVKSLGKAPHGPLAGSFPQHRGPTSPCPPRCPHHPGALALDLAVLWQTREGLNINIYIYLFIYLFKASKKYISPVFYGPCNSLETKPSISVLFASFWKWSLSLVRFLQDIGPGNPAFAGLEAAVSTAPATLWSSNLSFSIVALKLALV